MTETEQPRVRRTCTGAPVRSLEGALQMYQRGMTRSAIAMALGFVSGDHRSPTANGMERVTRLLEAAGVLKRRMK